MNSEKSNNNFYADESWETDYTNENFSTAQYYKTVKTHIYDVKKIQLNLYWTIRKRRKSSVGGLHFVLENKLYKLQSANFSCRKDSDTIFRHANI